MTKFQVKVVRTEVEVHEVEAESKEAAATMSLSEESQVSTSSNCDVKAERLAKGIAAEAMENLRRPYTLCYIDYRDEISAEDIVKMVHGKYSDAQASIEEDWDEQRWDSACEAIREAVGNNEDYDTLREDAEEFDELRFAIEERDESDLVGDLLHYTPSRLFRYDLGQDIEPWGDEVSDVVAQVAEAAGIDTALYYSALAEVVISMGNGGRLSVIWGGPVAQVVEACRDIEFGKVKKGEQVITFTDFALAIINPYEGSGWVSDQLTGATLSLPFDPENVIVDGLEGGYGWSDIAGCRTIDVGSVTIGAPEQ